jgi:hypothetical protein
MVGAAVQYTEPKHSNLASNWEMESQKAHHTGGELSYNLLNINTNGVIALVVSFLFSPQFTPAIFSVLKFT